MSGGRGFACGPYGTDPYCRHCGLLIDATRAGWALPHKRLVWIVTPAGRTLASQPCTGGGTPVVWRHPDETAARILEVAA